MPADPSTSDTLRLRAARIAREAQDAITSKLEEVDGSGRFREDSWSRPGGGGGRSRILDGGRIFEKAGVNVSEVEGELGEQFSEALPGKGRMFFATGVSLVLHPRSPRVPTVHANFRYIEKGESWWFGGGSDLTPFFLCEEDAVHFHRVWKAVCDRHDRSYYPRFKKWCDEYFYLPHRGEARGIGGIFFDELSGDPERLLAFWKDAAGSFLEAYVPIVERRRDEPYTDADRSWQLLRRGRYVEFNLLHDRGTVFGLKTGGRIESILMSLPPLVRWEYDAPEPISGPEAELLRVLREPRKWI
jgi:coproporphyrinogen III oxidase